MRTLSPRTLPVPGRRALLALLPLLGLAGCDLLFGPDDDPASVEISASRYTLGMVGDTVHLSAVVKDEGGSTLGGVAVEWESRSASVATVASDGVLTAAGNGSAWVVASSGQLRDSTQFTVASPIPCGAEGDLVVGETASGSLTAADCDEGGWYADIWRLDLETALDGTIELTSSDFDAFLVLLNDVGSEVGFDDDGGVGFDSRLRSVFPAGSYFVVASSYGQGETGDYELSVVEGDLPSPCPATADLAFPDTASGEITAGGACDYDGFYLDVWRLEVADDTVVTFRLDSDAFDPGLVIGDTLGNFFAGGVGVNGAAWVEVPLSQGEYDVWVGAAFEPRTTGSYTLSAVPGPASLLCPATGSLGATGTVAGELAPDDCFLFARAGDAWDLELTEDTELGLTLHSDGFAPALLVFDSAGDLVTVAVGPQPSVELEAFLEAGRYRVWVLADDAGHGTYTLSAGPPGALPPCEPDGEVGAGETVAGALATTDCLLADGRYTDVWTTRLETAATMTVTVTSDKFDAYLIVADSAGLRIAEDDDSGGSQNAALTLDLEAGLYRFAATSYAPDALGAYELGLVEAVGSAPATHAAPATPAGRALTPFTTRAPDWGWTPAERPRKAPRPR